MIRSLLSVIRRKFLGEVLWRAGQDGSLMRHDLVTRNLKVLACQLAKEVAEGRRPLDLSSEPQVRMLPWKATTQSDMESSWLHYWCAQLRIAPIYHRKLWEYAYVLQALHDHGMLAEGARGVGFGCGEEPIPAYLAARGTRVTVTDLAPDKAKGLGWIETRQHASVLETSFKPQLVERSRFDALVQLEYVDMNDVPRSMEGAFDFCWSICALEHLGSIQHGMRFVERAMDVVRPGGVAVHTTEFNYSSDEGTIAEGPVVLFQKRHFRELKERLARAGHRVRELDFGTGDGILDKFVDLPPYAYGTIEEDTPSSWELFCHLRVLVGEYPSTCFGLVVERAR